MHGGVYGRVFRIGLELINEPYFVCMVVYIVVFTMVFIGFAGLQEGQKEAERRVIVGVV